MNFAAQRPEIQESLKMKNTRHLPALYILLMYRNRSLSLNQMALLIDLVKKYYSL